MNSKTSHAQLEAKKQLSQKSEIISKQQLESKKQLSEKSEIMAKQQLESKRQLSEKSSIISKQQLESKKQLSEKSDIMAKQQLESKKQLSQKTDLMQRLGADFAASPSPTISISSIASISGAVSALNNLGGGVSADIIITGNADLLSSAVSKIASISETRQISAVITLRGDR